MLLIPLGVIWFGYSVMYYGWSDIQGPGMGFADLIFPSRINKAENIMAGWPSNNQFGTNSAATGSGPGTSSPYTPPTTPTGTGRVNGATAGQ